MGYFACLLCEHLIGYLYKNRHAVESSGEGQVHNASIATTVPIYLCLEMMSGTREVTICSKSGGAGAVLEVEGLLGPSGAPHALCCLQQELHSKGLSLQARCFQ